MAGAGPRPLRTVFVRDLDLACRIGVSEAERAAPQRIRINVQLAVEEDLPVRDEDLTSVVDYSVLVYRLRDVVAGPPARLVESLAERLVSACWFDHRVRSVRVRVEKRDLYDDASGVGIVIERHAPRS